MGQRDNITARIKSIEVMQSTDGWKCFEDYLRKREIQLINRLRTVDQSKFSSISGALKEIEKIKKFLKVEVLTGAILLDELNELENSI